MNPMFNSVIYYAMMSAMDKIGINPALFARQTATAISPIMKHVSTALGFKLPESINDFAELLSQFDDMDGVPDQKKTRVTSDKGVITLKICNCAFSDVSGFAESVGYKHCPVCLIGAVSVGLLKALSITETEDLEVQKEGPSCTINLTTA
jgi:hypothetical protein